MQSVKKVQSVPTFFLTIYCKIFRFIIFYIIFFQIRKEVREVPVTNVSYILFSSLFTTYHDYSCYLYYNCSIRLDMMHDVLTLHISRKHITCIMTNKYTFIFFISNINMKAQSHNY